MATTQEYENLFDVLDDIKDLLDNEKEMDPDLRGFRVIVGRAIGLLTALSVEEDRKWRDLLVKAILAVDPPKTLEGN